jgi:hypothetical protein
MVEIKINKSGDYIKRVAVEVKVVPVEHRFKHARECNELNEQKNCKITVEKKLTKNQQIAYDQIIERQKFKEEKYIKKKFKKK